MSTVFLKVKIKSLASESKHIRKEEQQRKGTDPLRRELHDHRVQIVRREARHTLLAYGYLRGMEYDRLEHTRRTEPDWEAVERMVRKYGPPKHNTSFEDWRKTK
jgi:hypothetical protein